jgi:hypothetical protein
LKTHHKCHVLARWQCTLWVLECRQLRRSTPLVYVNTPLVSHVLIPPLTRQHRERMHAGTRMHATIIRSWFYIYGKQARTARRGKTHSNVWMPVIGGHARICQRRKWTNQRHKWTNALHKGMPVGIFSHIIDYI